MCAHRTIRSEDFPETELAERVAGLQRVVEQLSAVLDPAQAGMQSEIAGAEDLVPQRLHGGHLGEEPMAADVEAPSVALDGPADPADRVTTFEHNAGSTASGQSQRGRQPCRPGTDDDTAVGASASEAGRWVARQCARIRGDEAGSLPHGCWHLRSAGRLRSGQVNRSRRWTPDGRLKIVRNAPEATMQSKSFLSASFMFVWSTTR